MFKIKVKFLFAEKEITIFYSNIDDLCLFVNYNKESIKEFYLYYNNELKCAMKRVYLIEGSISSSLILKLMGEEK